VNERAWSNDAAKLEIAKMLSRKGLLGHTRQAFGKFDDPITNYLRGK
jgi:hypothetical protein